MVASKADHSVAGGAFTLSQTGDRLNATFPQAERIPPQPMRERFAANPAATLQRPFQRMRRAARVRIGNLISGSNIEQGGLGRHGGPAPSCFRGVLPDGVAMEDDKSTSVSYHGSSQADA